MSDAAADHAHKPKPVDEPPTSEPPHEGLPARFRDVPFEQLPERMRARLAREQRAATQREDQRRERAARSRSKRPSERERAVQLSTETHELIDVLEARINEWDSAVDADRADTQKLALIVLARLARLTLGRYESTGPELP